MRASKGTVTYSIDEMEHLLNCMDNLMFIHEQPEHVQKEWREIINKANRAARAKWCEAVGQQKEE